MCYIRSKNKISRDSIELLAFNKYLLGIKEIESSALFAIKIVLIWRIPVSSLFSSGKNLFPFTDGNKCIVYTDHFPSINIPHRVLNIPSSPSHFLSLIHNNRNDFF